MATKDGIQGDKVLHAPAWYAKDPEIATWVDEDEGASSLHTCACDIHGTPICIGHDLGELRALGMHIEGKGGDDLRRRWVAADHEGPLDEEELTVFFTEAGMNYPLHGLPADNPRFMIPGDLSPLATPFWAKE